MNLLIKNLITSKTTLLSIAGTVATLGVSGVAQAAIITVPPDLTPGSQSRLVFVTDSTRDATSTAIADYNQFVTDDVTGSALATSLSDNFLTPTWFAIGSTPTVSAQTNTGTTGSGGVPIYLITGERVADDYGDLWDGSIQTAIDTTPGDTTLTSARAWTGTISAGTGGSGFELGTSTILTGSPVSNTGTDWIVIGSSTTTTDPLHLYAMSSILTVPEVTSTPEPGTLLGLGLVGLGALVSRRRKG